MRRRPFDLEEGLKEMLRLESAGSGRTKAERCRAMRLASADPLDALVGRFDLDPGDVDEVVYGR